MTIGKIMSWEEFREVCRADAYAWVIENTYKPDDLTDALILGEYPDDYFIEITEGDEEYIDYNTESIFTPEDFASETRAAARQLLDEN